MGSRHRHWITPDFAIGAGDGLAGDLQSDWRFVALAFVAASICVLWLTRFAPERFGIRFDSDTVHLLARVFDRVLDRYSTQVPTARRETGLHGELARYIVAVAQTGERDEDRLAQRAYLKLRSAQH